MFFYIIARPSRYDSANRQDTQWKLLSRQHIVVVVATAVVVVVVVVPRQMSVVLTSNDHTRDTQ